MNRPQQLLETLLGSRHVYFQSPENLKMSYPCIKYDLDEVETQRSGRDAYIIKHWFRITYITKNPESEMIDKIASIPYCNFTRSYKVDGLYHYVYKLYY